MKTATEIVALLSSLTALHLSRLEDIFQAAKADDSHTLLQAHNLRHVSVSAYDYEEIFCELGRWGLVDLDQCGDSWDWNRTFVVPSALAHELFELEYEGNRWCIEPRNGYDAELKTVEQLPLFLEV